MNTPNLCPQCGKPNTECNCQSAWANSINETVSGAQPIDKQYREQYKTHPNTDVISSPGKFDGERIFAPFYYDAWGNGCASEEFGTVAFFAILEDERKAFPELRGIYGLALEESEQGFVSCSVYDNPQSYEAAIYDAEHPEDDPYEFGLRDLGDEPSEPERIRCNQCEASMINGVFCHETGCPNTRAKYIDGEWIKFYECRECGSEIRKGEVCDCQTPTQDDDDAEVL